MNANRHRLVFNRVIGALVPVAETARAQSKAPGTRCYGKAAAGAALFAALAIPAFADQPAGLIPHSSIEWTNAGIDQARTNANLLTIQQTQPRAILDWQQFNLERGQGVVFDQRGNTNWSALNRIWDANPSTIAGSIRADGEIMLINRNGILFKDGAQLDMQSLFASTLDISNDTFNRGLLSLTLGQAAFTWGGSAEQFRDSLIQIYPDAQLVSKTNGRVVVLAPNVVNQGVIRTPEGQTILAAGAKVYLSAPTDTTLRGFLVEVDPFVGNDAGGTPVNIGGTVTNDAMGQINRLGQIIADRGNVTLAALAVNQSGRVRTTTTVSLNGSIRIIGRDTVAPLLLSSGVEVVRGARTGTVVFGSGSVTEVLPELTNKTTTQDNQSFTRSSIDVVGCNIRLDDGAAIVAPSGEVRIAAQQGQIFQLETDPAVDGVRFYVGKGSRIDVGGVIDVGVAMERNFLDVQLRGNELRDSPLLRNSFLRGKTVTIDVRQGTTLADVSGYLGQVGRTVGERSTTGGSITVRSEGDVITRAGSVLDVSGGSVKYADGYGAATRLIGADGKVYDIGTASRDRLYTGFADKYQTFDANGKVDLQIDSVRGQQLQAGYREGKSAGTIDVLGHAVVLDGRLDGSTIKGPLQRDVASLPAGGRLIVGDASSAAASAGNYKLGDIAFVSQRQMLPTAFDAGSVLGASFVGRVELDAAALTRGGFSRIAAYGNGVVSVDRGVTVRTDAGGAVILAGRRVEIDGSVVVPSGSISLESHFTSLTTDASAYGIIVGTRGRLLTGGLWTNDIVGTSASAGTGPVAIKGGSVSLVSVTDVRLENGSVIDVSGGAQWTADGRLRAGDAGSITMSSGRFSLNSATDAQLSSLFLDGQLRGYSAAKGGSLALSTTFVSIGGLRTGRVGELHLDSGFFSTGGFASYRINGQDGVVVAPGTRVQPNPRTWLFATDAATRPSGIDPASAVAQYRVLPWELRAPTDITLAAGNVGLGDVVVNEGAAIAVDPGGHVAINAGRQLTMLGRIEARAGSIDLTISDPTDITGFDAGQSIWFGASSQLDARAITRLQPNPGGLRIGEILDGGAIRVTAGRGTVVTLAGSRMDVSGIADVLDVRQAAISGGFFQPTALAGSAGSISLTALEGMLLDGSLRGAAGGPGASGGLLTIAMDRQPGAPLTFPKGPREISISQGGSFVPAGLGPGDAIDLSLNGRAFVAADRLRGSGFEMFDLRARDAIEFAGAVSLVAARGVELDAPVLRAAGAGAVRIDAPYVALGSQDGGRRASGDPSSGLATLEVRARQIDLDGITDVRGFGSVALVSSGDVRLRPVVVETSVDGGKAYSVEGQFLTGADTTITAQQFYPASFGTYLLGIRTVPDTVTGIAPDATLTINKAAGSAALPLSAGADLTLEAANIVNNGVIRVPFGRLTFDAKKTIDLVAGSITSVSGAGLLVPFGKTELSGKDYVYNVGPSSKILQLPPEKRVVLSAPDVKLNGTVDLRGGGDLYAYEFTVGPGGSRDILDPAVSPTSFAILPTLRAPYSPFDVQYSAGASGVLPGERIRLDGLTAFGDKSSLSDGSYVVLPARYALLPGAFLVTPISGSKDFTASTAYSPTAGSQVVAGRHEHAVVGGVTGQTRDTAFLVQSGAEVRRQSEYTETTADKFFAKSPTAQLPGDAGALSIVAATKLELNGTIQTLREPDERKKSDRVMARDWRGAEIDISAPKLVVTGPNAASPGAGFLVLEAKKLDDLKASSLLLGGTRTRTATSIEIRVSGPDSEVVIDNAASALIGPDVMLVAGKSITLEAGSIVRAEGGGAADAAPLRIEGGGAFVRASTGPIATMTRFGDLGTEGTLTLRNGGTGGAPGALVSATGSLTLDATRDTVVEGNSSFAAPVVSVASGRISFGSVPANTGGLVVSDPLLDQLGQVRDLTLRSYSSIDFHGAVALGAVETVGTGSEAVSRPFMQRLVLDAPGIGHYGAGDVTLTAGQVVVRNTTPAVGGSPFAIAPAGTGFLNVVALAQTNWSDGNVRVDGGNVLVGGFDTVAVRAEGQIIASGEGDLRATGNLSLAGRRVVAESNAKQRFVSDAALTVTAVDEALVTPWEAVAGRLSFAGDSIVVTGRIEVPGGSIDLAARQNVTLGAGAVLDASGRQRLFGVSTRAVSAGDVSLSSVEGDVTIGADALINVRSAAAGGDAGKVNVSAVQGRFVYAGAIDGRAGTGARGSSISVDAASLDDTVAATANDFGALNGMLNAGGVDEARSIRLRTGDLVHGFGDPDVRARHVTLATDAGSIDLAGLIDASGPKGGSIAVWSGSGIRLDATARFDASGKDTTATGVGSAGRGGSIVLGTTGDRAEDKLTFVGSGGTGPAFDVSGAGTARGGSVTFRVPRLGDDVNATAFAGSITGASDVVVEAYKVYSASNLSTSGATAAGGNLNISTTGGVAVLYDETRRYVTASSSTIQGRFGSGTQVRPGIEVRSDGDITLASDWNLCGTQATCTGATAWRFGDQPGVLTLRAGGNVLLNRTLSDGFNGVVPTSVLQATDSWSYRIAAGVDAAAANPLAVTPVSGADSGDIVLAAARMIRTGTGSIDLAARRDVVFDSAQSVVYTAGRPGPAVDGFNNPSGSPAPIFPNQGGDIGIDAGGDIRSAGSTQLISEWLFRDAKRSGPSALRPNPQTAWWVRFDQFQQGIGALAGGDVTLKAGGDVENVSAVIPTNARLGGPLNSAPDAARFVEQGGGDLVVDAGGNVAGGLFYVSKGTGSISAAGSVTTATTALTGVNPANPFLALGDAIFTVTGRDSVAIESAFNPTSVAQSRLNTGSGIQNFTYAYTYAETSAVKLGSARGDVVLSNDVSTTNYSPIYSTQLSLQPNLLVYPGKVDATAYSGDVAVRNAMFLYPSKAGDFNIFADGSVALAGNVFMSDVAPSALPSVLAPDTGTARINGLLLNNNDFGTQAHTNPVLHADDRDRVEVIARTGDIVGLVDRPVGNFAKPVLFQAGGDIRDVWVVAQNLRDTDRSVFRAGGDFLYSTARDVLSGRQLSNRNQIVITGPGELLVEAGRSIDLGNSAGLVTRGNIDNPFLPEQGAAIRLSAGGAPQGASAFIRRYVEASDDPLAIRGADFLKTMRTRTGDGSLYLDDAIARILTGPKTDPLYSLAGQLANARSAVRYRGDLIAYLRGIEGETGFVTGTARDRFEALSSEAQTGFVNHVLFAEVKAGGREALDGIDSSYVRGYEAIGNLFPGSITTRVAAPPVAGDSGKRFARGDAYDGKGDINLFFSQIKTEQGGDIEMRVPNGLVNAGLANPGDLTKSAAELGIVTVRGGTVRSFASDDFLVNQSRVFTLQGGDILVWSSWGNIDAGKGAKTASATPPPQLVITPDGRFVVDTSRSVSGSGIGVLLGRQDVRPGDIDLIAPTGAVDAGDAGISGPNVNIIARFVFNTGNISGTLNTNASNAPISVVAPVAVSNPAADAQKALDKVQQQIGDRANQANNAFKASFLTVEVIALGDDGTDNKKR